MGSLMSKARTSGLMCIAQDAPCVLSTVVCNSRYNFHVATSRLHGESSPRAVRRFGTMKPKIPFRHWSISEPAALQALVGRAGGFSLSLDQLFYMLICYKAFYMSLPLVSLLHSSTFVIPEMNMVTLLMNVHEVCWV